VHAANALWQTEINSEQTPIPSKANLRSLAAGAAWKGGNVYAI